MKTENIIKIVLIILLLVCLLDMPYGFYTLTRFVAMIGFGFLAYSSYKERTEATGIVIFYIALAILFQPLIKISLGRTLWNAVDVIVAIILLVSLTRKR